MNTISGELLAQVTVEAIEHRRDLHRHPELGWTEFRTASRAAAMLTSAGWQVQAGDPICELDARMGVPDEEELAEAWRYAGENGGDPHWMDLMRGGSTAVVATLDTGRPGPVTALRFDMDALPIDEATQEGHRPAREGFRSRKPGVMHACGHDAHTAIGVAVGRVLSELRSSLSGTIRIILQPAEEGTRGAASIVAAGVLDDVDYFLCPHVGAESLRLGSVIPGATGFLATEKLDLTFSGTAAHAGLSPESGQNALIAAAHAVLGLHGISRHSGGNSRVNVGTLVAGAGRNIIPPNASLKFEVRGDNNAVLGYLSAQAQRVTEGAAKMAGVSASLERVGHAPSAASHPALVERVASLAQSTQGITSVDEPVMATASDDATAMMERVSERGGQACYLFVGTPVGDGHHTPTFDIEERCIGIGIELLSRVVLDIAGDVDRQSPA
jgi:aminobenzoyl-glutamate utilization protein A